MPTVDDSIELKQDVGVYEPSYKIVRLNLMSDGTVQWEWREPNSFLGKIFPAESGLN